VRAVKRQSSRLGRRAASPVLWGAIASAVILIVFGLFAVSTARTNAADIDDLTYAAALDALQLQGSTALEGKTIYFAEAAGEAGRFDRGDNGASKLGGLLRSMGATLLTLDWRATFPTNMDLLVIAGPVSDYSADQQARVWAYITNGGRALIAVNPTVQRSRNDRGSFSADAALFSLMFTDFGLRPVNDVIAIEGELREITLRDENMVEDFTEEGVVVDAVIGSTVELPRLITDFTTSNFDAAHPITANLDPEEGLRFFNARSMRVDVGTMGGTVTPLVFSPEGYYGETNYTAYLATGLVNDSIGEDTGRGSLPVALAYQNDTSGARIVLIGDREMLTNGAGFASSPPNSLGFLFPGNVRFTLNSFAWLLDTGAPDMTFPTPGPTYTPTITPSPTPTFTPTPQPEVTAEATAEAASSGG